MISTKEIQDRRKEIAEIRHAESVFRDITARLNERENYEKRWFWELLQNAKDSTDENLKSVKVKIEISNDEVSFSHSGLPFELDDILSLIIQGSTKGDKPGKTGRFGTGFMTTYLLSRKVIISGKLTDGKGCFQFLLNRDAYSRDEFLKFQEESNSAFETSIQSDSYLGNSEYQTKFTYTLDTIGKKTAEAGLHCLDELIPVTQLFNEQIESVLVSQGGYSKTFTKERVLSQDIGENKISKWKISTLLENVPKQSHFAYILKMSDAETCMLSVIENDIENIVSLNANYPRLYFTFPLIGTEEIGIPIIINSEYFKPRIERDGIYLKSSEENDATSNKTIIEEALSVSLKTFGEYFSKQKINGIPELFNLSKSKDLTWIDHEWLRDAKKRALKEIKGQKIIQCEGRAEFISLEEISIPLSQAEDKTVELWKLLKTFKGINVPVAEEVNRWADVVENMAWIEGDYFSAYNFPFVAGVAHLINKIADKGNLTNLETNLIIPVDKWINSFYKLVVSEYLHFPLDKKIVINQQGELRNCEGMSWDDCKDSELNQLSNILGLNFGANLFAEHITPFHIVGVGSFAKDTAINELKTKLNELNSDLVQQMENLQCHARFVRWLLVNNRIEALKGLKIITGADKDEKFNLELFRTGEHLFLAPKKCFNDKFPLYAGLVRDRDCLNDVYYDILKTDHFQLLDSLGLIHISPLIMKKEQAPPKVIEYLISNESDLKKLKDKDGQYIHRPILTYTDFAYLTGNDSHIYGRTKSQKASFEKLRFLLEEASERDHFLESEVQEIDVLGFDAPIKFNTCVWVARAKQLQWVYYKVQDTGQESNFFNESPSSKSLSELLKYDETLVKSIRGSKQQLLLHKLGVGVSDLIRNTLASEELRFSWDKAITNMIISDADPELVQEIFNNADIQAEYEKKLIQKKLIGRNQQIGALVEQLFKECILELKNEGYSVSIERKPFGSDYIITEDSADLVNEKKQEEIFEINEWLVELKATGKSFAAMTELQAKTASANKEKYALVIVELDGSELDLEYVRKNATVLDTIGEKIGKLLPEFNDIQYKKSKLTLGEGGVSVNIDDNNIRFRVQSNVWRNDNQSIKEFVHSKFKNTEKLNLTSQDNADIPNQ